MNVDQQYNSLTHCLPFLPRIDSRLETLLDSTDNVAANSALAQTSQEFVASAIISVQTTATKLPKLSPTSTPFSTLDEHSCHSAVDENKQSDFDVSCSEQCGSFLC